MLDKETIELSQSYLQKAFRTLENIPKYIEMDDYTVAVNRSYYAAFYSLKALEILGITMIRRNTPVSFLISDKNMSKPRFAAFVIQILSENFRMHGKSVIIIL